MSDSRKPLPEQTSQGSRPSAQQIFNDFLKTNGLAIGQSRPEVSFTEDGMIIIKKSQIGAFYIDEIGSKTKEVKE